MLDVYVYGSGECDQLGIDSDEIFESARPRKIPYLNESPLAKVYQVTCGGMHTLVLTTMGKIFSWGANDDGALGREGSEKRAEMVNIPEMTNITAGDSFSIAYNTELNVVYQWGVFRNTVGNMSTPIREPKFMERKLFQNKKIKKIISGENHALAIAGNSLYGWGNSQMGQIGKMLDPTEENQSVEWSLKPQAFSTKNVTDVFTGKNHSFSLSMKGKRKVFKSWGLNCFKQLGLGHRDNTCTPTEVQFFVDMDVKYATGGDNHSIVLLENGDVYVWGRNDRGQCGLVNENKAEESLERNEDNFTISIPTKLNFNCAEEDGKNENAEHKKITAIAASMDFSYALDISNNQAYSWGTGDSYVLGTKEEDDANTPFAIPKVFFKNQIINNMSLGANHVIFTMRDAANESEKLPSLEYDLKKASEQLSHILELNKPNSRKKKSNKDFVVPETSNKRERKKVDYSYGRKEKSTVKKQKKSVVNVNRKSDKENVQENISKDEEMKGISDIKENLNEIVTEKC